MTTDQARLRDLAEAVQHCRTLIGELVAALEHANGALGGCAMYETVLAKARQATGYDRV
jgi:hypothetical protein